MELTEEQKQEQKVQEEESKIVEAKEEEPKEKSERDKTERSDSSDEERIELDGPPINFDEIIYESQPTTKIQELDYNSLKNHSHQFRVTFESMEKEVAKDKEVEGFHAYIVKLIQMIQPSKIAISSTLQESQTILDTYYPQDSKLQLRKAAKEKNILVMNKLSPAEEKQLFDGVKQSINHLKRALLLRQSQLGMVLYIEDNREKHPKEVFEKMYEENFRDIMEYVVSVDKIFEPINYVILEKMLEQEFVFLEQFATKSKELQGCVMGCYKLLQEQKIITSESKLQIDLFIKGLKVIAAKIFTIADLFPFACIKSKEDLFSKDKAHPRWKDLFDKNHIKYKIYGEASKVMQSFDAMKANLNIVNAAMNIMDQTNQIPTGIKNIGNLFESFHKVLQVAWSKDTAQKEAEAMISNPNPKLAKDIWNLPQRKQFKTFVELSLPSITYSIQGFIPRLCRDYFQHKINKEDAMMPDFTIYRPATYFQEMTSGKKTQGRLSIRINNYFALQVKQFKEENERQKGYIENTISKMSKSVMSSIGGLTSSFKKSHSAPKSVIFHIHGGGFISMTSFIHQIYTRQWSNNLQVPIVSVDYGKAPQCPFPQGLEDCLEAYLWTLHCMKQLYEFQPQKIILVGDSAGGNLVVSLVNLLLDSGLRVPDGIVLVYPALNLVYYDYTPSLLTALNDMILPHTFLKICLKAYLSDDKYKPDQSYYVSPILTPDYLLKQYPPIKMFVGSKDPFHDDCCRFTQRLSALNPGKVHLTIFEEFPHGFLQFDMKNQPHYYCKEAVKEVEAALRQLLEANKE